MKLNKDLKNYFDKQESVEMAFIFGSRLTGKTTLESDFDIAVYFKPKSGWLECETEIFYPEESTIWNDLQKILKSKVDLIVLNRAPAILAFPIINEGMPIVVKNRLRYLDFLLKISARALDFRRFMRDFREIKARSKSLGLKDQDRLIKLLDFLEGELADYKEYENVDFRTYENDAQKRRGIERWVENLVNASIDIAKVMLASQNKRLPDTYAETLKMLVILPDFQENIAKKLAKFTDLRNILAHEYLDLRFLQIQEFIKNAKSTYGTLLSFTDNFLKKNQKKKAGA